MLTFKKLILLFIIKIILDDKQFPFFKTKLSKESF